ncbi:MAG: tetratricopeptide repeat protein [Methanoregula sp.]
MKSKEYRVRIEEGNAFLSLERYDDAIRVFEDILKNYPGDPLADRSIVLAREKKSSAERKEVKTAADIKDSRHPKPNKKFGSTKHHPVPVSGISGELAYLKSLYCPCSQPFMFHRLGAVQKSPEQDYLDCYELRCRNNIHHFFLYLDPYQNNNSPIAPSSMTIGKKEGVGCNFFIPDFDSLTFDQMPEIITGAPHYHPDDPQALFAIMEGVCDGRNFLNKKEYTEAIARFDKVLQVNARMDQAWYLKCRALDESGNKEEAEKWRTKGRIIFPDMF